MQLVNIQEIKNNENNPRIIKDYKFKQLVKSIKEFPEMLKLRPIVVNSDMIVLGGNMRLKACKEAGLKEVWILKADELTEEQQREFIVKDNVGFGEWDWDVLANEWNNQQLEDWGLDLLPFEEEDVLEAKEDDFDTTPPEIAETVLGDLYEIGEHRLLCGDSTDSNQVAKLMNGQKADMVFTDPPYGIGYEYNSHKDTKGEEYLKFCEEWFNVLQLNCELIIITTGWSYKKFWWNKEPSDELVWFDKTKQSGGRSYHLRKTEPIFIFGKIKEKYTWDILEIQSNRGDGMRELHTCPKPIALISDIIKPQTINNSIILDVFLGSGTTMLASHQLKRKCYGMELDPKYCDVIIKRMIKLDDTLTIKRNGIDCTNEWK
jgi:DNA modification methylase